MIKKYLPERFILQGEAIKEIEDVNKTSIRYVGEYVSIQDGNSHNIKLFIEGEDEDNHLMMVTHNQEIQWIMKVAQGQIKKNINFTNGEIFSGYVLTSNAKITWKDGTMKFNK